MKNVNNKNQIYIDDDFDKIKIFESSETNSSLQVAKYSQLDDISLFDTGASRSGTNDESKYINLEKCSNITVQGAFSIPEGEDGTVRAGDSCYTRYE